MEECARCGKVKERDELFEAISNQEIIKVCEDCAFRENVPLIKKPTGEQLQNAEKPRSVYERLSRSTGLPMKEEKKKTSYNLNDITEKNLKMQQKSQLFNVDLIDNFHWLVMRARRAKRLTQKELATAIGESESTIKRAENGVLDDFRLVNKFEDFFGIKLRRSDSFDIPKEKPKRLSFDPETLKNLTISDLREMKRKKEEAEKGEYVDLGKPLKKKSSGRKWYHFFTGGGKTDSEEKDDEESNEEESGKEDERVKKQ